MKYKKPMAFLIVFLIFSLYFNVNIGFSQNENYVQNPGFENGFTNWSYIQSSNNPLTIKSSDVHTGSNVLNYWASDNFTFTVSQTVYNLPKGKYKLSVWTMGGNNQQILTLFVKYFGGAEITQQIIDTGWPNWNQWSVEFNVKTNYCTIGITCTANADNWGYIDDFELIKLPSSNQIVAIKEVNLTAAKGNTPKLPQTVDVVYDDESEGKVYCEWDSIDNSLLFNENTTFSVYGTVYGTDLKAKANINVQAIKEIKTIEPINIIINEELILPSTVLVSCYNNDQVSVNVYWQNVDKSIAEKVGVYTVNGSIYGTNLVPKIVINVNYKDMDLNADGKINIGDVAIATNYLSKGRLDSDWEKSKIADINNDGKVDINDLRLIVKKIKGQL